MSSSARVRESDVSSLGRGRDIIRIVIADGHDLYRHGMQLVVDDEPDIEIVAEATSGGEVVEKCLEFDPDVVLLDVRMPGNSGIEACAAIKAKAPRTKILILTASEDEVDLFSSITAGASGYLLKDLPTKQLTEAVRLAHSGQSMIPPRLARPFISEFARLSKVQPKEEASGPQLSDRELEVLSMLGASLTNREIAAQLCISENTVKNHVRNIFKKLQLHSRTEAALYAARQGLVEGG